MTSRGVQPVVVAIISSYPQSQSGSPVISISITATATTGRPVAVFTNRWLSSYFNLVINRITSFHIYVEFFIFLKKNQIFEFNYIIFLS